MMAWTWLGPHVVQGGQREGAPPGAAGGEQHHGGQARTSGPDWLVATRPG